MRALWLFFVIGFSSISYGQQVEIGQENWQLLGVVDGDTIKVEAKGFPDELSHILIRIRGVDAPERGGKAKCEWEYQHAELASQLMEHFLSRGTIRLQNLHWDKYGGRILADVYINGQSLADMLIKAGMARPYDGKKRGCWCN